MNDLIKASFVISVVTLVLVILLIYDNLNQWDTIEEMAEHTVKTHTAIDDRLKALEE